MPPAVLDSSSHRLNCVLCLMSAVVDQPLPLNHVCLLFSVRFFGSLAMRALLGEPEMGT